MIKQPRICAFVLWTCRANQWIIGGQAVIVQLLKVLGLDIVWASIG